MHIQCVFGIKAQRPAVLGVDALGDGETADQTSSTLWDGGPKGEGESCLKLCCKRRFGGRLPLGETSSKDRQC